MSYITRNGPSRPSLSANRSVSHRMKASASSVKPSRSRAYREKAASRIHTYR